MTWVNRLRLLAGLLGVLLLVAILTLIFNQRQTKAASISATINADSYSVGAAYGGTVTKQYVNDGDFVAEGDRLFTVQSVSLQQDVANGLQIQSSAAYDVDTAKGALTYRATVAGEINDLQAGSGTPWAVASHLPRSPSRALNMSRPGICSVPVTTAEWQRAPRQRSCCPTTPALAEWQALLRSPPRTVRPRPKCGSTALS